MSAYKIQTPRNYPEESIRHFAFLLRQTTTSCYAGQISAVCSEIHTIHIDTMVGQKSQIVIAKAVDPYNNQHAKRD